MLCWWFIQVVNRYIIIYFDGEAGAGLYIATSKIATLINIFGTIFLQAWTIATVKGMNDEDKGEFNTNIFRIYSTFLICAASALMFILPLISGFLLQENLPIPGGIPPSVCLRRSSAVMLRFSEHTMARHSKPKWS